MRSDLELLRLSRTPGCTVSHIRVYAALAARTKGNPKHPDFGWCWPAIPRIASDTDLSVPTVLRCLKWLEERHLVYVQRGRGKAGKRAVNRYWMLGGMPPDPSITADTWLPSIKKAPQPSITMHDTRTLEGNIRRESQEGRDSQEKEKQAKEKEALAAGPAADAAEVGVVSDHAEKQEQGSGGNGHSLSPAVRKAALVQQAHQSFAKLAELAEQEAETKRIREEMISLAFAYWAIRTNHLTALQDPKRERTLRARLTENKNDINEILYVVDGLRRDKSLMGENDRGRKFDGIETIYRDRAIVERLSTLGGYTPGATHPQVAELQRRASQEGH